MEVLVTVVILSIGLLGVAGLQFGSLRGNQSAFHSSIAAALAADGADRLRANVPGARDPRVPGVLRHSYDMVNAAGADPACIDTGCSYDQVAQHDAYEWITSLETQLPSGQGVICRDSTPYDGTSAVADNGCDGDTASGIFAIKIWWDHDRGALDDAGNPTPLMAYRVSLVP